MLKKAVSKAAASEEARRTLRHVEPLSETRTKLANFFSILLEARALFSGDPYLNRLVRTTHIQLKSLTCLDLTEAFRFSL